MCLCEKCEFLAIYFFNYLVMILEEKSQHMGPFIECIFALKNVRSQQWIEEGGWGGVGGQDLERPFWTSLNLSAMFLESHERDGDKKKRKRKGKNFHLVHIFIEKQ